MTKTAFICWPGVPVLGMGRDLYDHYPIVKEIILIKRVRYLVMIYVIPIDTGGRNSIRPPLYATSYFSDFSCYLPLFIARKRLSA